VIAKKGRAGFYEGAVMQDLVSHLRELGGPTPRRISPPKAATMSSRSPHPIRGHAVHEIPPNGQGIGALIILKILSHFDMSESGCDPVDRIHLMAEATKAAYWVRDNKVGDPTAMRETPESILDDKRIAEAVAKIKRDRAQPQSRYDWEEHKDTTYLTVVDRDRNAVSFINSLFQSFGSASAARRAACCCTIAASPSRPAGPSERDRSAQSGRCTRCSRRC